MILSHFNGHRIVRNPHKRPHYYQRDAVNDTEASEEIQGWDKSLVVMPTGSGKSFVTGELCARSIEAGGRSLFLAHTRDLVKQPRDSFEEDFGCPSTIEMASQKADDSPMVFASVATMANRIKSGKWRPDTFKRIIFDESHRVLAAGHQLVADHFGKEGALITGCTATPRRGDKKDLLSFFDGISYDKPIQELFAEGFLIEPTIIHEPLGIVVKNSKPSDFTDDDVADAIDGYLEAAADIVMKYAKGRCGVSFLPLRRTAERFCQILRKRGLKCEYVAGKGGEGGVETDEQKRIKNDLLMGRIEHVCNAMLWSEGTDLRPLTLLVDLRPSMVWTAAMQKWGRLTRTYDPKAYYAPKGAVWPLKTEGIILDFCFETEKHSMIQRPAVMVGRDDEEVEQINRILAKGGGGKLMDALKSATNEREETLRRRLEAMRSRDSRTISAMELFMSQKRFDLVEWSPSSKSDALPITDPQRAMLAKCNIDSDSLLGRGHAMKVIDMIVERRTKGLATIPQVQYCQSLGHPDPWSLRFEEASRYINLNKRKR